MRQLFQLILGEIAGAIHSFRTSIPGLILIVVAAWLYNQGLLEKGYATLAVLTGLGFLGAGDFTPKKPSSKNTNNQQENTNG